MCIYHVGEIITGKITGIKDYGVFLSFNSDYSGLLHISEISNNYVSDVNSYAKVNDSIKVKIIDIDENNKHLKLSIKAMHNLDKKEKLTETGEGFKPLADNLDYWINNFYE